MSFSVVQIYMRKLLLIILMAILLPMGTISAKNKYALLVGISNYHAIIPNTEWNDIHGVNDVRLISPILRDQGFHIDELLDDKATYKNIISRLNMLIKRSTKGAIVYLHFSCHGQPFEDLDGDEQDGWDESIVPVDAPISYRKGQYEGQRHLIDDELNKYVERLRQKVGNTGYVYVVIDACHSGRSSRDLDEVHLVRGTKRGFSPSGLTYKPKREKETHYKLSSSSSMAPITYLEACKSTQYNTEIKRHNSYYGPLSYYISRVLAHHILGTDNKWAYKVKEFMNKDISVQNQDMVIETSN